MKTLRTIGVLVVVAGLISGGAGNVFAEDGSPLSEVEGTITAIEGNQITIEADEGDAVTLTITEPTGVYKDGEPASEELAAGQRVEALYYTETKEAVRIVILSPEPEVTPEPAVPEGWFVAKGHAIFGTVESIASVSEGVAVITLETKSAGSVLVTVTEDTTYRTATKRYSYTAEVTAEGSLVVRAVIAEIKVDDRLVVWVETGDTMTARWVLVLPSKPMHQHLAGVITEISDSTVTVTDKEGNTFTVDLPEGLTGLEVGQFVTLVISEGAPGGGKAIAKAAYRFDKLTERLSGFVERRTSHLEKLQASAEAKLEAAVPKGIMQNIDRLNTLLEWSMDKHLGALQGLLEQGKLPEQAGPKIERRLQMATEKHQMTLQQLAQRMDEAKAKWEIKQRIGEGQAEKWFRSWKSGSEGAEE